MPANNNLKILTWGVDDIDPVVSPRARSGGSHYCDATRLLLFHPVRRGRSLVPLADLVTLPSVEKNALSGCGLAGVDVRHNTDVAVVLEGDHPLGYMKGTRLRSGFKGIGCDW